MAKNIDIGGRLHSVASGNVVAGANEILDDAEGKKQNTINAELRQAIIDSQINETEATVDESVGTPSATAVVIGQKLILAFQNIMGDGIASIEQTTTSEESEGVNVITVTTVGGKVGTFQVRNGAKGDTVILGEGVEYVLYNGTGQNTDGAMTQRATTDAIEENTRQLKAKLQGVSYSETKYEVISDNSDPNCNVVIGKYINGYGIIVNAPSGHVDEYAYCKVDVENIKKVRVLGGSYPSGVPIGYDFGYYDIEDTYHVISKAKFEESALTPAEAKELILDVPQEAKILRITCSIAPSYSTLSLDNFYCYLQTGDLALSEGDVIDNLRGVVPNKPLSSKQGNKIGCFAYFINGDVPVFSDVSGSMTITFNQNMRLYNNDGGAINDSINVSGQSFSLSSLEKLVYDYADGTVKKVANSVLGNYIVLLAKVGTIYSGVLSDYYNNNFNKAAYSQVVTDNAGGKYRDFVKECYLYGNINSSKKYRVELIYRDYSNEHKWVVRIKDSDDNSVCVWAGSSDNYGVLTLDQNSSSGIFGYIVVNWDIIAIGGIPDANIVLSDRAFSLEHNSSILAYTRALANEINIKRSDAIAKLNGPTYPKVEFTPSSSSPSIIISFYNSLVIYSARTGEILHTLTLSGQSFTIGNDQKLVYDTTDSTTKVVSDSTSGQYIILLTNNGGSVGGIVAKYVYKSLGDAARSQVVTTESNTQYRFFVKECYLYGNIDKTKTYRVELVYRDYGANHTWFIRVKDSANNPVCSWVGTFDDYGVLAMGQYSSSGIFGYIIVNWDIIKTGGISDTNIVLSERAYSVDHNPAISAYLRANGGLIISLYNNQTTLSKLQNFGRANASGGKPTLKFLHLSDIHAEADNVARAIEFKNMYSSYVDDILNTGDTVLEYYSDGITSVASVDGWENILSAIGNHDTSSEIAEGVRDWGAYAGADAYARYIGPYISNWGVTHDGNTSHCYYYKDYTTRGFRLIVLDNMVMPTDATHYDSNQITWFRSVLASAKTANLAVICAWHFPSNLTKNTSTTFCSLDSNGEGWSGMSAFTDAVDDFINGGGEFVCWLTGHIHSDLFGTVNGHTDQIVLSVPCTRCYDKPGDMSRVKGTKTQDCFNMVAFDYNVKTIKVIRIGADYDRYLRHKDIMCYNYVTKSLV